ncbi:sugar phosphate isomerase/epimerase family protein [Mariniblastus fucicola]|uniref:Inosose dehydratase n=1 Tax=Mariniblastus fucicola TaxID=980251 RepID=A0A5B9PMU2_9BACT|nr:sugar phosphate isomerase/epimerase [Mariniblastus fucicola]QEG23633.1 Inosose dehydratase [Mariniblastus fucicola]
MKRRTFIAGTAAAATLSLTLSKSLRAMQEKAKNSKYLDTMGLQLWTVRNQLAEDQSATLKAIADAGYKQVELGRVVGSESIVKEARELGMKVTSSFVDWNSVLGNDGEHPELKTIVATAKEWGLEHLVFGYIGKGHRETVDLVKKTAAKANAFGEMCNDADVKLCYHNHSFEFKPIDGETTGFDILMNEFDNDKCKFELDVFWAKIGGWDPIETLKKLDGRITQVHLKDLKEGAEINFDEGTVPHDAFEECGDGSIDMAEIMKVAEEVGALQCHVEQDQSPNPIESMTQSFAHLKGLSS